MSEGSKSINRIIRSPNNKASGYSSERSPESKRISYMFSIKKKANFLIIKARNSKEKRKVELTSN